MSKNPLELQYVYKKSADSEERVYRVYKMLFEKIQAKMELENKLQITKHIHEHTGCRIDYPSSLSPVSKE